MIVRRIQFSRHLLESNSSFTGPRIQSVIQPGDLGAGQPENLAAATDHEVVVAHSNFANLLYVSVLNATPELTWKLMIAVIRSRQRRALPFIPSLAVKQPEVEHKVRMRDFKSWLESTGRTPVEMSLKTRLRELSGR